MRQIVVYERLRKAKLVFRSKPRLSVLVKSDLAADDIAVSSNYRLRIRIPDQQLLVRHLHSVEFVQIKGVAGCSSGLPEGYLAQPAYLEHDVGSIVGGYDVYLVVTLVGHPELSLGR